MRIAIGGVALALACLTAPGRAASTEPVDASAAATVDTFEQKYRRDQRERFETLRSDSSPRMQVLAGRFYLDKDDPASKLLPKPEEVVMRAAQLAPDDAFVQWVAADAGSYASSACGPTTRPEKEVANLVRLEPDNAAAWQYAAALAVAKGDSAGVDAALAHMADAKRADDHQGEEVQAWRKHYADHPEAFMQDDEDDDEDTGRPNAQTQALSSALQKSAHYSGSVGANLETACKPDATTENPWQRLGWCAHAGELLATRGNSFDLRDTGLKMLAAAGATSDDLADLKRNQQWLIENAAMPMRNVQLFREPDTIVTDWNGASDEIVATQNRLKRLGKPLTPPAGWVAKADTDDAQQKAALKAWTTYMNSVLDDLRSGDARERAVGLSMHDFSEAFEHEIANAETPEKTTASDTALADLAAANPDNAFVQWIAATSGEDKDEAISSLQRLEPDNAAAWALGLKTGVDPTSPLQRAAKATRFDDHMTEQVAQLYAAFQRHPMPADMPMASMDKDDVAPADEAGRLSAFSMAMSLAVGNMHVLPASSVWLACKNARATTNDVLVADCAKIARLMLHSGRTLLSTMIGAGILRTIGALDGADREYARQIEWWQVSYAAMGPVSVQKDLGRYADDYFATGSEIEALRRAMARVGKAVPPADWQPVQWKAETPKASAASK